MSTTKEKEERKKRLVKSLTSCFLFGVLGAKSKSERSNQCLRSPDAGSGVIWGARWVHTSDDEIGSGARRWTG